MFEALLNGLARRLEQVQTLGSNKTNLIRKVDNTGIYVETEQSRDKFERGEKQEPYESLSYDYVLNGFKDLITKRTVTASDFQNTRGRTSFLMAFFAELPFVEVNNNTPISITLKEFATDDLPSEQYEKVKLFLEEVISEKYDPKLLSSQTEGNLYRIKSRGRQDSRLLGFIDNTHRVNKKLLEEYKISTDKDIFLQKLILRQHYFNLALSCLDLIKELSKSEKKQVLVAIGRLIVRNSRGSNLMVESVAQERTHNLLMWLESTDLIDESWIPRNNYFRIKNEVGSMDSNFREMILKIMGEYLSAKTERFGGHQLGNFVRNEVPKEINKLTSSKSGNYIVTGSVGQGNWASVPWIAIMNNLITTSTQRGYYIVYLFSEDMKRLYLTLAQGVTETSKEEMVQIKQEIRENIKMAERIRKDDHIDLGVSSKAKQYALSTAAYISYSFSDMPSEEILVSDLEDMIQVYENYVTFRNGNNYNSDINGSQIVREEEIQFEDLKELINHIHSYIISKGFYYKKEEVMNLFLSVKTKPFVILSGISGTGKTKMVQWFAESLGATEANGQFALIPIRPDWNDGSDLLGYVDIKGEFKSGPLTNVIREAEKHPSLPYFVLLDEMNLARVEYYFSDILSVMESRKWKDGEIVSSPLLSKEIAGEVVTLPNNLFVIGTVNMDETTHPFSKKVLDRANTIEFSRIELNNFSFLNGLDEVSPSPVEYQQLASRYLHLKDLYQMNAPLVEKVTTELVKINHALQLINAHVGYRVRDEICFYMAYNEEGELMPFNQAFDHCILQKILPRVTGSDSRVEQLLKDLYQLFTNKEYMEEQDFNISLEGAIYPNSADKVVEMLRRLREDGFTSFWIS